MVWNRTECSKCSHYYTCPPKTKLFINYCGSKRVQLESLIQEAKRDCLSRRGLNYMSFTVNQDLLEQKKCLTRLQKA